MAPATLVSLDEYLDLPERAGSEVELLGGRLIETSAPAFRQAAIQARVSRRIGNLAEERFPHLIEATHTEFIMDDESAQSPDVLLIDRERQRRMEVYRGALRGSPELAVEVISPNEKAFDVDDKVPLYLKSGTKTVWVVWPNHVTIHHANGDIRDAQRGGYLDAPDVIPGARIAVNDIYPE